ncbi:MAG: OadG family protein [Deltaproteobacteria bacterium]|nr:OadG family protein [Deltaproteobacteria bacterium]
MTAWQRIIDGDGLQLTLMGMGSVFFALAVLSVVMSAVGRWFTREVPVPQPSSGPPPEVVLPSEDTGPSPQIIAAISAALAVDLAMDEVPPSPAIPLNAWQLSGRRAPPAPKF